MSIMVLMHRSVSRTHHDARAASVCGGIRSVSVVPRAISYLAPAYCGSARPLLCGSVALGVAACGGGSGSEQGEAKTGGIFRMNISTSDVQYLDPALEYEFFGAQLLQATCARLLNYRDVTGKAGTELYEVAAGPPTVHRTGRPTRSPSGRASGSTRASRSRRRASSGPHTGGASEDGLAGSGFMQDIVGALAFHDGKARTLTGVSASGDKLLIRLTEPSGTLENRVAFSFFSPSPRTCRSPRTG